MKSNKIYNFLYAALLLAGGVASTSCADDLEIKHDFDQSEFEGIYENSAYLCDAPTGKRSQVVELYLNDHTTKVGLNLSKPVTKDTKATVKVDASWLQSYNKARDTEFEIIPEGVVTLENDGVLSPVSEKQLEVGLTIALDNALEADKTYALPLTIETSGDLKLKEESKHCLYFVRNMSYYGDCFKGEDLPKGYLFFETGSANPLNALQFQMENGKFLWDVVVLFAGNINIDPVTNRPCVRCNPETQYLLDNNETFLQPLRKRGMKVLLGILGNHDQSGVAQLSKQGAKDFARELAQYCKAYNLDGINYDDEYSNAPDLGNPALAPRSLEAAMRLCYETKQAMPDKLVTVFGYGLMYGAEVPEVDGVPMKDFIDIVVPNYGNSSRPYGGLTKKECAGFAMEFNLEIGGNLYPTDANWLVEQGYGWFMGFAPFVRHFNWQRHFKRLTGAEALYGSPLKTPTHYYKMMDSTPYPYE